MRPRSKVVGRVVAVSWLDTGVVSAAVGRRIGSVVLGFPPHGLALTAEAPAGSISVSVATKAGALALRLVGWERFDLDEFLEIDIPALALGAVVEVFYDDNQTLRARAVE